MRTRTRIYKTEKGYFKNSLAPYENLQDFFGRTYCGISKDGNFFLYKVASDELKSKVADIIIARHFGWRKKSERELIKNALMNGMCDLSYLRCFYTDGSNSLSGDAYSWCKRKFLRSIW